MMAHVDNDSTQKAEANGITVKVKVSLVYTACSKTASVIHTKNLSQEKNKNKKVPIKYVYSFL